MFEGSEEEKTESGVGRARRVWCIIRNVAETQFCDVNRNVVRCGIGEIITDDAMWRVGAEVIREEGAPGDG